MPTFGTKSNIYVTKALSRSSTPWTRPNPECVPRTLSLLGDESSSIYQVEDAVWRVRKLMVDKFSCSIGEHGSIAIRANRLESLRSRYKGPDDQIFLWRTQGAPVGIREHVADRGIFPHAGNSDEWEDGEKLDTPDDKFVN